jgi:zinc and cadmium transporter
MYSVFIAASSLLGGWLPGRVKLSHTSFQLLISLVGGLLLGIGVFHLLAHSVHELGVTQVDTVSLWVMGGMMLMFFLLRAFHVHHHAPADDVVPDPNLVPLPILHELSSRDMEQPHEHHVGCDHGHGHSHGAPTGRLGWAGLFFGLGVHTLLDGLALGAAMQADAAHGVTWLVALGVLLGIVLHKPLDSLSITTLMMQAGRSSRARWTVNFIYASLCPIGATAFLLGVRTAGDVSHTIVGCSLAFSAGAFICIALADLLPEMEFHSHDRWRLSIALLLGIALAWAIRFLEPAHLHG